MERSLDKKRESFLCIVKVFGSRPKRVSSTSVTNNETVTIAKTITVVLGMDMGCYEESG